MSDFKIIRGQFSSFKEFIRAITEKPVGADFDWKRLLNQVLEPISQGSEGQYQRYDWETDILAECHTVPVGGIVVVEGVYSIRQELENKYDIKIWIDCPREIRLSRGIKRDGADAREMWEDNWIFQKTFLWKSKNHLIEQTLYSLELK